MSLSCPRIRTGAGADNLVKKTTTAERAPTSKSYFTNKEWGKVRGASIRSLVAAKVGHDNLVEKPASDMRMNVHAFFKKITFTIPRANS
jgi:hypothetical protein